MFKMLSVLCAYESKCVCVCVRMYVFVCGHADLCGVLSYMLVSLVS